MINSSRSEDHLFINGLEETQEEVELVIQVQSAKLEIFVISPRAEDREMQPLSNDANDAMTPYLLRSPHSHLMTAY